MSKFKETIIVDTDIFIDLFRGNNQSKNFFRKILENKFNACFSTITEAELFAGKKMNSTEEQRTVSEILRLLQRIDFDGKCAQKAGELKRKHKMCLPDACIAASALINKGKVVTRNTKHFSNYVKTMKPY